MSREVDVSGGGYPIPLCCGHLVSATTRTVDKWVVCILLEYILVTEHKRSLGQGSVFTGVCLSKGGVCLWVWGWVPLGPGGCVPLGLGVCDWVNKRAVRIILGCFLVARIFTQ